MGTHGKFFDGVRYGSNCCRAFLSSSLAQSWRYFCPLHVNEWITNTVTSVL